jgi:hypothetical protein
MSPIVCLFGQDLVDFYRIWDAYDCGGDGDAHDCMMAEPDALIVARMAIGEAPSDANDQVYVMWLIRLRAELGFKNARLSNGWCGEDWCYRPGRWGEPTTIRTEALCVGGCQFSPAKYASHVYFPCLLSETNPARKMLCPTDDQLADFDLAYRNALAVLAAPLQDFPQELRGYDNFRSPSITGPGQFNRVGGLPSEKFWPFGNIWRDEFLDDNIFWGMEKVTPTPRPVADRPTLLPPTQTDARLVPDRTVP